MNLSVAEYGRNASVFHVALPSETLESFRNDTDALFARVEFQQRRQQTQQLLLRGARLLRLLQTEQARRLDEEGGASAALQLHAGQCAHVQPVISDGLAECDATVAVISG